MGTPTEQPTPNPGTNIGTMRAVVQHAYGIEALRPAETERPAIAADEVLVEVRAAGLDRGVWHLVTGRPYLVRLGFGLRRPDSPVPGFDVAGRVAAVGSDVDRFRVGDDVFGIARGSFAQYAAAREDKLALRPAGLGVEAAAVATISGITALQALTDVGRVQSGQGVLVIGASGGVGSYAVQLARVLGATVTGVASGRNGALVRSLGADHVLDYAAGGYLDGSTRYELIIDTGGLNPLRHLRRALTRSGTLVIVGGEGGGRWTGGIGRQIRAWLLSPLISQRLPFFFSVERRDIIERLAVYLASGAVQPAVGRRYRLDEVPAAIADLAAGRAAGKSVIVVKEG